MEDESPIMRINNYVQRLRTSTLVNLLMGTGWFIIVIGLLFPQTMNTTLKEDSIIIISFFFIGLSGLPIIIRREADFTIFSFQGLSAAFIGVVISFSGFFTSILFIIGLIKFLAK